MPDGSLKKSDQNKIYVKIVVTKIRYILKWSLGDCDAFYPCKDFSFPTYLILVGDEYFPVS